MGPDDLPDWLRDRISAETAEGCWLWVGSRYANGYGRVYDRRTGTKRGAHRVVHEMVHGVTLTRAQVVDHLCGHITCVRHTEVVSNAENIRRAYTRPSALSVRQQQSALRGEPVVQSGPAKFAADPADPLVQLNVRLPTSMRDLVWREAKRRGISVRQAGREAFAAWAEVPGVLAPPGITSPHGTLPAPDTTEVT